MQIGYRQLACHTKNRLDIIFQFIKQMDEALNAASGQNVYREKKSFHGAQINNDYGEKYHQFFLN